VISGFASPLITLLAFSWADHWLVALPLSLISPQFL
jgi:hypothetical protein